MRRRLAMLAVLLAAVLPYVPTLDNYFAQDDFGVVWRLATKPLTYFPRWFYTTWMDDVWGYVPDEIRPFPALSYQLATLFGAANPVPQHLVNVGLHALNAWLVFGIAETAAGLSLWPATLAAVVFAVLPMQTESVAWVTGRVDSMPACAYLACFWCYARWRAGAGRAAYWWSVVLCFVALFTKQNAVTLVAAVAAYDVLVCRRRVRPDWETIAPYVPFAAMTAGYLAMRWWLFGEVAREGMLTAQRVGFFLRDLSTHARRMVFGERGLTLRTSRVLWPLVTGVAATLAAGAWLRPRGTSRLIRPALFFLVAWIGLAVAPTVVAGYASPRHVYLASSGWALLLGIALEVFVAGPRWLRVTASAAGVSLVLTYATLLAGEIGRWEERTAVSRRAVEDVSREAAAAPRGALIIAGAPRASWDFSLPHALRPPFTAEDVTARVSVISHSSLHCCPAHVWEPYTRERLRAWAHDPSRPPVIAMHWDPRTGALARISDADDPFLREMTTWLLDTPDVASLDRAILDITDRFATLRR